MKDYTLIQALQEIVLLFPFTDFGNIANIEGISYYQSKCTFTVVLYNDESYFIDLDSQTYSKN